MAIYIDEPLWPAHGTRWSHLVSDDSLTELHRFAGSVGIPARAFDGDHYDVPAAKLADLIDAGAQRVGTRKMVHILVSSGLRAARPRSAKPKYRSRDKALAAAILTPPGTDSGLDAELGSRADSLDPIPDGYERLITGATLQDVVARAQRLTPAVDAVIVVDTGGAAGRLRAVYLDWSAIDGRSRYRHPAGALVLGRAHWSAVLAGGLPRDETLTGRNTMASPRDVEISDTTIRLGQLLKLAGIIGDGSEAKMFLAGGGVSVNGEPEGRRGRQVHPGDIVDAAGQSVRVVGA